MFDYVVQSLVTRVYLTVPFPINTHLFLYFLVLYILFFLGPSKNTFLTYLYLNQGFFEFYTPTNTFYEIF